MSASVPVRSSLGLTQWKGDARLLRILDNTLADIDIPLRSSSDPELPYWDAAFFALERDPVYLSLSEEKRTSLLTEVSRGILLEASAIEKSASCFTAKMTLLSETGEERALYSLFGAEEVAHHRAVRSYLPAGAADDSSEPFIQLLSRVLEEADKQCLTFVIQVVLEGWGISHFGRLAAGTHESDLRRTFEWFVRHEARHHGSGAVLFEERALSPEQRNYLVEVMRSLLHLVQLGPQALIGTLARTRGDLSRLDLRRLFERMEESSRARLEELRRTIRPPVGGTIYETLEELGLFIPLPPEQCADLAWREL